MKYIDGLKMVPNHLENDVTFDWSVGDDSEEVGHEITAALSHLEGLSPDLSSLVLSHLLVQEIATVSGVSQTMRKHSLTDELWRRKFKARWNIDFSPNGTWLSCYQEAYSNPHDLWITHWNCVYPSDGDAPGRCCIPSEIYAGPDESAGTIGEYRSSWMQQCPSCRYQSLNYELPNIVHQALEKERQYEMRKATVDDPVEKAETVAAAHSLLLQGSDGGLKTTRAKAVFATTQYSIAKFCRRAQRASRHEYDSKAISSTARCYRARRAFTSASTFHRKIRSQQYQSSGLFFLDDALFFNVGETPRKGTQEERNEMSHLRQDVYGEDPSSTMDNSVSRLGHQVELSHHTWHDVRFMNPDYTRPITFRVYLQRSDCFTVYPSEGYLEPGQSCHITLGVRPFGSLLSETFEMLDVHREAVDPFLAEVYSKEAHLPFAPYVIRYMFAPIAPCVPPLFTSRGGIRPSQTFARPTWTQAASSKYKNVVEYLWDNVAIETVVRSKHLSAHVNSNYGFDEFQRAALFPFEVNVHHSSEWGAKERIGLEPRVFVAPNLLRNDPILFERLQNIKLETELSDAGIAFRTEKNCSACGGDWGYRSEELGRAYILQKLVCDLREQRRHQQMCNVITCLRRVSKVVQNKNVTMQNVTRIHQVLYFLHNILVQRRSNTLVSSSQQKLLVRLEVTVDDICVKIQDKLKNKILSLALERKKNLQDGISFVVHSSSSPTQELYGYEWRNAGVYRHVRCTDSIFRVIVHDEHTRQLEGTLENIHPSVASWKDEPDYLNGFRHLCHNPGFYSLGKQEDPNHDDEEDTASPLNRRFYRKKWGLHTDVYMDSALLAFASALSMIHDPRSLLVHGVYDRQRFPGTVARRPYIPDTAFLRTHTGSRDHNGLLRRTLVLLSRWRETVNFKIETGVRLNAVIRTVPREQYYLLIKDLDIESHMLLRLSIKRTNTVSTLVSPLEDFIRNIPPPGVGKFALTGKKEAVLSNLDVDDLVPLTVTVHYSGTSIIERTSNLDRNVELHSEGDVDNVPRPLGGNNPNLPNGHVPGVALPRMLRFVWLISASLGWAVDESQGPDSILVDRRILIASQWLSNTLMAMPVIWTLLARCVFSITPKPIAYHLEGLPFEVRNKLRYLSENECAFAAIAVTCLWLYLGRYSERSIGRSFERTMLEHLSMSTLDSERPNRISSRFMIWCQRQWDRVCPLFMQRLIFTPRWNRRSRKDLLNHIAFWRSKDFREHRPVFCAELSCGGVAFRSECEKEGVPIEIQEESPARKFMIGAFISLGSFCTSSPHFFLNLLTVFCCSIGLGLSMSLQSMETGRGLSRATETQSILKPFALNTLVIGFFLVGQLIGSSGGILFLAEFVVTSLSLILGGAGTVSAAAMESWACFFCLSSMAFWGYLFARVAISDGMRHKRRAATSLILLSALLILFGLWIGALFLWRWEMPPELVIVRNPIVQERRADRKYLSQLLQ